nr:MAG TPA: hypothetical protein [Caudoviricetes sp.]
MRGDHRLTHRDAEAPGLIPTAIPGASCFAPHLTTDHSAP